MIAGIITEMPARFRGVFTELVGLAGTQDVFKAVSRDEPNDSFKACHFQINLSYSPDVRLYFVLNELALICAPACSLSKGPSVKD